MHQSKGGEGGRAVVVGRMAGPRSGSVRGRASPRRSQHTYKRECLCSHATGKEVGPCIKEDNNVGSESYRHRGRDVHATAAHYTHPHPHSATRPTREPNESRFPCARPEPPPPAAGRTCAMAAAADRASGIRESLGPVSMVPTDRARDADVITLPGPRRPTGPPTNDTWCGGVGATAAPHGAAAAAAAAAATAPAPVSAAPLLAEALEPERE
jgi:hypothetical protein